MKRLIRGVIYDNPDVVEDKAYETAEFLTHLTDSGVKIYEEKLSNEEIPNRDEFIASLTIAGLCHPSPDEENMIIPSSLVDDRLYNDLKKIDIGEDLVHAFMSETYRKYDTEVVEPQDFCKGEEECLLRQVDKQNENRGKYFLDGKEVSAEEMIEFMENEPELADVVPFIKAFNGKVSCF